MDPMFWRLETKNICSIWSQFFISSNVSVLIGKYENMPYNWGGIRSFVFQSYIEWSYIVGLSHCIMGISLTVRPAYLRMNGGFKLCFMVAMYNTFCINKIYVFPVYGQLYATMASTIGTFDIPSTSLEKAFISSDWPVWLMINAWRPSTIIFAWEWSYVIDSEVYSSVGAAAIVAIFKYMGWFPGSPIHL